MSQTMTPATIAKTSTAALEEILDEHDTEYDDETPGEIEAELERRDYDDSDPAVVGARQDAQDGR